MAKMPEYSEEDKRRVQAAITGDKDTSRAHVYGYELDEDGELVRGECSSCQSAYTSNQCHDAFLCSPCLQVHGTAVKLHGGTMEFKGHLNPVVIEEAVITGLSARRENNEDDEELNDRTVFYSGGGE
jgi:hypothetical protein